MATKAMKLCLDLFIVVLAHAQCTSDILNIGKTCSKVYPHAVKEMMRRGVTITTDDQFASFLAFINSDIDGRAPRLRVLDINLSSIGRTDSSMIANLIRNCPLIENLSLAFTMTSTKRDLNLEYAICGLSKLRVLRMNCTEWNGLQDYISVNLHSNQLKAVEVRYSACGLFEVQLLHPVNALTNHAPTLRKLCVQGSRLPLHAVTENDVQYYPNITTLQLDHCLLGKRCLPLLMRTFPNLRHLLADETYVHRTDLPAKFAVVNPWNGLEYFEGSLKLFRDLNIRFPIRHWEISDWLCCFQARQRAQFKTAVTKARISRLTAYLHFRTAGDLEQLFEENSHLRLTHISLQVNVANIASEEIQRLPDLIARFAHTCKAVNISLGISRHDFPKTRINLPIDPQQVASRFFASIPSLQRWGLWYCADRDAVSDYWVADATTASQARPAKEVLQPEWDKWNIEAELSKYPYTMEAEE